MTTSVPTVVEVLESLPGEVAERAERALKWIAPGVIEQAYEAWDDDLFEDDYEDPADRTEAPAPQRSGSEVCAPVNEWDTISQLDLQGFLWYSLPVKWGGRTRELHETAWALGDCFRAAGKERFAQLCREQRGHLLIELWQTDRAKAAREFRRLLDASGVIPPDTDFFAWGSFMGMRESSTFYTVSDALAAAIDSGRLVPGGRAWRQQAARIATETLQGPSPEVPGLSLAGAMRSERRHTWFARLNRRGLQLSPQLADAVAAPCVADLPAGVGAPTGAGVAVPTAPAAHDDLSAVAASMEPLAWLMGEIGDGVRLTQTGNLPRALVEAAEERYGWYDSIRTRPRVRTMWDLPELAELQQMCSALRWVARRDGTIRLTPKGRKALADPAALARAALGYLLNARQWQGDGGLASAVALLEAGDERLTREDFRAHLFRYLRTHWRVGPDALTVDRVHSAANRFSHLATAFGWLQEESESDRFYLTCRPLNEAGRAACLVGLRLLAAGPSLRP